MKYIISFIIVFGFYSTFAQTDDIRFRRVSPPGGFSFQAIHSFNQDKFGYIWMGGFDGVLRYDSKEIIRFSYQPEKEDGLPSNTVTGIAIDKDNNIWASTDKGLCKFNPIAQEFEQVHYTYENGSQPNNHLFSIQFDGHGNLWIVDEHFFGYIDETTNKMIRITEGLSNSPRLIYNDETNRLWLGTLDGSVYKVHHEETKVEKLINGPGSTVRTISTSTDNIWVGYQEHGARMYDFKGELKHLYQYTKNPDYDISNASIRKIWRDTRGQIWIGSYLGLFKSIGKELTHYDHNKYEGLPHNSIFDIFEDNQGGIWIGTWSGGVAYIHHSDNRFTNYRHSNEPGTISDNMVSSFAQTPDGQIYVGTELFGLNRFNPKTASFTPLQISKQKGIIDIKAMEVDKDGGLWIGSAFNGLFYRPATQNNFIHFPAGPEDGTHVSAREVYSLCNSDSGIWIGTNLGGINFYNFKTKEISFKSKKPPFEQLLTTNCLTITTDTENNLWIGTQNGTIRIHLPTEQSTLFNIHENNYHKTGSQSFYFIKQLSDGRIWMGTRGNGINIYNPKTDSTSVFTANDLLKNKDVYGIIEDSYNNIWITSNDGLILYNSADNSSRRFVLNDGIQGNLFNPNAIYKDKDDNIYFGGTNGFSLREPKPIHTNKRPPNVLLTKVTVNNRSIVPVQTGINQYQKIVLDPKETNLNFNFSADNYLLPDKNEFSYRLINYIDNWVANNNRGSANFVNLPAGEYRFEVKASNNDGIWNEEPTSITIVVEQFWYKSTYALWAYSFIFLLIIIGIIRFFRERSKLKKDLLIEKMEHKQEEQLTEMKLKFFTNISHEFRTPLTLIDGPVKQLLTATNLTDTQHKQLDTVKRNTSRLLQLINQIMDLRKAEKGMEKLKITKIDLVGFVNERVQSFSEEARTKNITFSFNYTSSSIVIEADEEKLDKIIFNLLSNAFKYTPANGEITISINENKIDMIHNFTNQLSFGQLENENYVEISVIDSGQGINSEDLPHIFERFEQGKSQNSKVYSTGIGLNLCKDFTLIHRGTIVVQSSPGKGTRFSIQLPTKQKAQKILFQSHEVVKNVESWQSTDNTQPKLIKSDSTTTILVVEDNNDLREFIIDLLNDYYKIFFAEDGKQGLEMLQTKNIDLVISDVMMPKMDGFEFCQTIKSQIETSHIPVILLTALSSAENTSTGLEKGADAYISKPFDEQVLLSQIANLLNQRKRLQENYAQRFISKQTIDLGSLDNYFLNKINTIVEENMTNENFTVDLLASEMSLSRSQLHRKLKQISNHSASEYITMVKIKKATALLATKSYNVDEVAFKVGFNSHSYFSKCFKKIHGQTPKEYIKGL
ncbi:two-component regulator propeller domain-containing protein [uncultured Draconibacterium sp.]|uniref:hybrid sensor histidine kinase/response regulator transcription factor n=1 Tax=uncultured Draconibacterium sp. TaxID=1573823 RepID=UPI002AA654A4|nr:two-component regulator propeller domain-containing protein [uncultured Draconibacterium sp.]